MIDSVEYKVDEAYAKEMDAIDPMADFRAKFYIPKEKDGVDSIYLCGNSLGLQPKTVRSYIEQELKDWETLGVKGHVQAKNPWVLYHKFLTEKMAALVGGKSNEVVTMNGLTVNLHLMMVSFYRPTTDRHKILIVNEAFPSDQYAVKSQIRFHGYYPDEALLYLSPREGEHIIHLEDVEQYLETKGSEIALILLEGVHYYTGQAFNIAKITEMGHKRGCIVGWDLAHAAGNLVMHLHDWDVDFAVWCNYKYLNGGPGCIGGCFVHEKHGDNTDLPRFEGWWGQNRKTRWVVSSCSDPIKGAEGWQLSNPPILSLASLRASLEIFEEAGIEKLREKSKLLTGYLEFLINDLNNDNFFIITPSDPEQRGNQLSLLVQNGGKVLFEKLGKSGVVCDWREPNVIRIAPVPLYNTYMDVYSFVEKLKN